MNQFYFITWTKKNLSDTTTTRHSCAQRGKCNLNWMVNISKVKSEINDDNNSYDFYGLPFTQMFARMTFLFLRCSRGIISLVLCVILKDSVFFNYEYSTYRNSFSDTCTYVVLLLIYYIEASLLYYFNSYAIHKRKIAIANISCNGSHCWENYLI